MVNGRWGESVQGVSVGQLFQLSLAGESGGVSGGVSVDATEHD